MKKPFFLILKKQYLIIALIICIIALFLVFTPAALSTISPQTKYTIVIDAGHGKIDGGCEGAITKVAESTLNLDYAKCLKQKLEDFGFKVVMTRTTENGLYNPLATNKKKDDMKKRKSIIENANADFVISIHMNSFSTTSSGAQVFYGKDDEAGKMLATSVQSFFVKNLASAKQEVKVGDYYILNEIKSPSILVECGYLSNPKEETLLLTEEYKNEICYNIVLGVLQYLQ